MKMKAKIRISKKTIFYLILGAVLIINYNDDLSAVSVPGLGMGLNILIDAIFIIFSFPYWLKKTHSKVFSRWTLCLLAFWFASIIWSSYSKISFDTVYKSAVIYVVALCLSKSIENVDDIVRIIKYNFIAVIAYILYIVRFINFAQLGVVRIGADMKGLADWNANDIGMMMGIGLATCIFYILQKKKSILMYILAAGFGTIGLFSGSRKAVVLILGIIVLTLLLESKGQGRLRNIALILLLVIGFYILIMNNPKLYNILGHRVETLLRSILGKGNSEDYSLTERSMMTAYGLTWFMNKPILGSGFGSFAKFFGAVTGWEVYSHNNLIELLVSSGIVGTTIYYSIYVYIIIKLLRNAARSQDKLSIFLVSLTIILTVLQTSFIIYSSLPYLLILMLAAVYAEITQIKKL